ncbi:XrtA-associated tyrosine autokinase [Paraglaciecola arctica]|uniref:XrtA-associated tyrosine autokinase n=1 Tax=Paraglaciecola arctica TaxID=1128911 RepID=UPI001C07DEAA|nr:XrtA-associated tyrosine autokinase [Paraglaciecola arctica]MBU3004309.1 XrtA-associated tyrosine autokinase [Paraglaciecola arctica]
MNSIEKALQKQQKEAEAQNKNQGVQPPIANEPVQAESSIEKAQAQTIPEQTAQEQVTSQKVTRAKTPVSDGIVSNTQIEIDLDMLAKKGFVSTDSNRQVINEEYRVIKRKLLDNAFGPLSKSLNNSNVIMVTSSRQGEGKTFTAINLALSIALEQDKTVLLVDADVLRPNVMRTLELKNEQGLMEYLLGDKENISEVMCRTNLDNLRIISAGKSHHLSAELLASERMFDAVEEFANRYPDRIVIVDTPPLLGINETAILANLAGQALVVTEEFKTKLFDVENAVKHLNPEMAIGFVVNKTEQVNLEGGGYGYYYGGAN